MSAENAPSGTESDPVDPVDTEVAENLRGSNPNSTGEHGLAGGMGLSSETVGPAGPGQTSTDGLRDVSPAAGPDPDAPPEQSMGGHEPKPLGLPPKAAPPKTGR